MEGVSLTAGAIANITNGGAEGMKPVLQVMDLKLVPTVQNTTERFRIVLLGPSLVHHFLVLQASRSSRAFSPLSLVCVAAWLGSPLLWVLLHSRCFGMGLRRSRCSVLVGGSMAVFLYLLLTSLSVASADQASLWWSTEEG